MLLKTYCIRRLPELELMLNKTCSKMVYVGSTVNLLLSAWSAYYIFEVLEEHLLERGAYFIS